MSRYGYDVVTVPGFLRGYRRWVMNHDSRFLGLFKTKLRSIYYSQHVWETVGQATCLNSQTPGETRDYDLGRPRHDAPDVNCSCGFYASYDTYGYKSDLGSSGLPIHQADGSVRAFGRISLGTIGFRAQYAQIESLWGFGTRAAARHYDVPWFRTEAKMLAKFPPQDVKELLS